MEVVSMDMPADVQKYLSTALKTVDWATIRASTPDLCAECPQYQRTPGYLCDDDVCLQCPWWGVLTAHMIAQHWRPRRRPRHRSGSQGGGPDHD